jgi:hypothetical protein
MNTPVHADLRIATNHFTQIFGFSSLWHRPLATKSSFKKGRRYYGSIQDCNTFRTSDGRATKRLHINLALILLLQPQDLSSSVFTGMSEVTFAHYWTQALSLGIFGRGLTSIKMTMLLAQIFSRVFISSVRDYA